MLRNGPSLRALFLWMSRASCVFPVPVSPPIKTEMSERAILSTLIKAAFISGDA